MPICANRYGDVLEDFFEISEEEAVQEKWFPITHALVVAKNRDGYLFMFNRWKNHWEVAGGMLEEGESLRQCALRELLEETNQIPSRMWFRGLMKFHLRNGKTEYGGLFCAYIDETRPFQSNEEAGEIVFWDGKEEIGYVDEIDRTLIRYYLEE